MPKLFSFIRKYCIQIDYSKYSLDELLEAKKSIDKVKYAENFNALMIEFSRRETEINARKSEAKSAIAAKQVILKTTCTAERILGLFLFGLIFGFPVGFSIVPDTLDGSDVFFSLLLMSMSGGLLFHSFNSGWTFGGNCNLDITEDPIMFTVAQLIYAWLLGFSFIVFVLAVFL
ncbi:hypothetical protein [Pseudoalteromonas sp. NSLLW218]|uniref:hypothetical protein n=1 Tax=Pseudoalteromonas sp. NSLLW218 TaxID=2792048 RepID=UPI0018CF3B6C|nr:hypothetical protein [Pseudoalteromonas sp. NSLLW218]MBH0090558.1 hypothetical protein [Pseudoalteromonas sp. NSLLW218]